MRERKQAVYVTHKQARHWIDYDPETGICTRRYTVNHNAKAGDRAGAIKPSGHRVITVLYQVYMEHVFIWFWMTGEWPPEGMQVDHKNRVRDDNRWCNLRLGTPGQNQANTNRYGDLRGISKTKYGKYRVRVVTEQNTGIRKHIGVFETIEKAVAARDTTHRKTYGEWLPEKDTKFLQKELAPA